MAGMFGADALERKFGKTPPPEWNVMLDRLKDFELDRGIRRLAYSGKQHVPSLPEFTKLCRMVGDDSVDEGPQRVALPAPSEWNGDAWDIESNQRLLKFLTTMLTENSKSLGQVIPCRRVMHPKQPDKFLHLLAQASDQQAWSTAVLVGYKQAWARDMREYVDAETGEILPPSAYRQKTWNECMARAMSEIRQRLSPA